MFSLSQFHPWKPCRICNQQQTYSGVDINHIRSHIAPQTGYRPIYFVIEMTQITFKLDPAQLVGLGEYIDYISAEG